MARRTRKKSNVRSVDFSQEVKYFEADLDVELVVKSAEWEDGNEHPYIAIVFTGVDDYENSELYHNASASPKSLFRLRALLEAFGLDVPDDGEPMDIDTDELVGLHVMAHTFEDSYVGNDGERKKNVKAEDFWAVESKSSKKKSSKKDDDDEDDKPAKKSSKKGKKVEKIARSEVEEMDDRDDLEELIERFSLDIDASSRKLKKDDSLRDAILEALEEGELLEDDDEEEKPAKKKRGAKKDDDEDEPKGKAGRSSRGSKKSSKKSKTWTEDEIADMDEDELEATVEESGVELDLEEHKSLRKKKNALIDALEEAELLER